MSLNSHREPSEGTRFWASVEGSGMDVNAAMVCQAAQLALGATCQAPTDRRPEGTYSGCGGQEPSEGAIAARQPGAVCTGGVLPPI